MKGEWSRAQRAGTRRWRCALIALAAGLSACGEHSDCPESGDPALACKTGATEPLYKFQWALRYADSFFAAYPGVYGGGSDLDVEPVHEAGIKGQGVKVLVLDDGLDIANEDLAPNVDRAMSHNFDDGSDDPTPAPTDQNLKAAHGTAVAGVIAAAQNGKGVMGIAPRIRLGGARYLIGEPQSRIDAYGGADWAKGADVINASFAETPEEPASYDEAAEGIIAIRAFPKLRDGKGLLFIKSAGNEFLGIPASENAPARACSAIAAALSCENPAYDPEALEPGVIVVAAMNAMGRHASYSNAGPVNWIAGLGGEPGPGDFGEIWPGPAIFTTDLSGCSRGFSRNDVTTSSFLQGVLDNTGCNYAFGAGTSAAAPTISGIVALMLSVNPDLTWRDVREILRATARPADLDYGTREQRDRAFDLARGQFTTMPADQVALTDGAPLARLDYGWQVNGAGYAYADAFGFGLADAAAAVRMASGWQGAHAAAAFSPPDFVPAFDPVTVIHYGAVQKLGDFDVSSTSRVDELQLRINGSICVGSVGFFVRSPAGTVSTLSVPYNVYYASGDASATDHGLASYAFYGESAAGTWTVYAVNGLPSPEHPCISYTSADGSTSVDISEKRELTVEYRIIPRLLAGDGVSKSLTGARHENARSPAADALSELIVRNVRPAQIDAAIAPGVALEKKFYAHTGITVLRFQTVDAAGQARASLLEHLPMARVSLPPRRRQQRPS